MAARPPGAVTTLFRMRRLRGRSGWSASLGQWTRTALSAVFRLRTHRISLNPPMSFPIIDRAAITSIFESSVPTRPSWSPQGRYLVYSVARPNVAANQIVSDIWLLDTEHCASERIISGISGSDPAITWAPDGARFAYLETSEGKDRMVVVDLNGSTEEIDLSDNSHGRIATHPFFSTFTWATTNALRL